MSENQTEPTMLPVKRMVGGELIDVTLPRAVAERAPIDAQRAADRAAGLPACRVCGCTQNAACEGGCAWHEPNLCTACVDHARFVGIL